MLIKIGYPEYLDDENGMALENIYAEVGSNDNC